MSRTRRSHQDDFPSAGTDHPDLPHADRKDAPQFMPDDARILAFTAIAALLDSGLPLEEAVTLLTNEYRSKGSPKAADLLGQFFGAVAAVMSGDTEIDLKAKAAEAFGSSFVSLEEALVLSALPRSTQQGETLRAAAGLAALKGSRPVSQIQPRGLR